MAGRAGEPGRTQALCVRRGSARGEGAPPLPPPRPQRVEAKPPPYGVGTVQPVPCRGGNAAVLGGR
eukprot:7583080-Lingulodinium_polyedra.AAC.1